MRPVSGVLAMSMRYTCATEPFWRVKSRASNHCDSRTKAASTMIQEMMLAAIHQAQRRV
jgi:hypothetical protein